jgi:hypothetical protein
MRNSAEILLNMVIAVAPYTEKPILQIVARISQKDSPTASVFGRPLVVVITRAPIVLQTEWQSWRRRPHRPESKSSRRAAVSTFRQAGRARASRACEGRVLINLGCWTMVSQCPLCTRRCTRKPCTAIRLRTHLYEENINRRSEKLNNVLAG